MYSAIVFAQSDAVLIGVDLGPGCVGESICGSGVEYGDGVDINELLCDVVWSVFN